jgi:hypothetical protein
MSAFPYSVHTASRRGVIIHLCVYPVPLVDSIQCDAHLQVCPDLVQPILPQNYSCPSSWSGPFPFNQYHTSQFQDISTLETFHLKIMISQNAMFPTTRLAIPHHATSAEWHPRSTHPVHTHSTKPVPSNELTHSHPAWQLLHTPPPPADTIGKFDITITPAGTYYIKPATEG